MLVSSPVVHDSGAVYSRHPHGKAFDDDMRIERLQDILRNQTVVDALVLVLFELRELVLPYVHHFSVMYRVQAMRKCETVRGGYVAVVVRVVRETWRGPETLQNCRVWLVIER
jgi:hypothetical protein